MTPPRKPPPSPAELRRKAEARLRRTGRPARREAAGDAERLVHELQVHQVELELQNEELRRARDELEASLARVTELYDFAPVGYLTLDHRGAIVELNFAAATLLGAERGLLVGQRLGPLVGAAGRPAFDAFLAAVGAGAAATACTVPLGAGGGRTTVQLSAAREEPGGAPGWRCRVAMTDVTERTAAEEVLRSADRHKDEFLATLSHELRNPLAAMHNSLYLLELSAPGSERANHAREVLRRQTGRLTRLVDDLLDVTRIARGNVELRREVVDLRGLVRASRDEHRARFEHLGLALRVEEGGGPVWTDVDAARLAQVVGNLLHNASKFTPRGGTVALSVEAADGRAELRVRDDGMGMEPGQVARMFEPFEQGEGQARGLGGLGLGLSLAKGLVELHGGSISASSAGPGQGAEFLVVLPLSAPGVQGAVERWPEPRAATAGDEVPRKLVLVIEDDNDAALTLAAVLESMGHRVRVAHDGRAGVALAREVRPDVVFCDIGLPDMSGHEVARTLRAEPDLRSARLVALTGQAQVEHRERAVGAGFDAHLAKPAPLAALREVLAEADGAARGGPPHSG